MADIDLPRPTWHRGMYGSRDDMYTAEQMRQFEAQVRAQIAADIEVEMERLIRASARYPNVQRDAAMSKAAEIARGAL